ncbi:YciI family protein [Polaromonas sp. SM01]|uniref:YciI family protein n=1 Tax=Polaromonas sp. SM01 TaxID=3085630 RepID=UPI0029815D40|nr:YciI family protein [Polaromonas sp. SM01]MDW5443973.1 YciI family protein [Polaromonas sp. SM01]
MAYMLLIHEPTGQRRSRSEAEGQAVYARMLRFGDELKARGQYLASESLGSQAAAARIQVRGGQAQVLDGPFAEAKEMVGGFFLINCATREEAVAIARECPAAEWATIEVRSLGPCYEEAAGAG